MVAIRKDYINVYYRGGNILRVTDLHNGFYDAFFDKGYSTSDFQCPALPETIETQGSAKLWADSFQTLKGIMDIYFSRISKLEREFQQLVARENNFSSISNGSEYFISDIEFADSELGARFDLLALRWLASQRKIATCRPALLEMKYGDGALSGNAGVLKHLQDINELMLNPAGYQALIEMMEMQFNQLDELGLIQFNRAANWTKIKIDAEIKPEVILIFANHNPRSHQLRKIISSPEIEEYAHSEKFDLRFYVSSFAGYALHAKSMLSLPEFRKLLKADTQ